MPKLIVFNQVTLDGFFADAKGDMSWAHRHDAEWNAFVEGNAKGGGILLFGRITYQMMASFWPTPQAFQNSPVVAERMNNLPKIVFSKTLDEAAWKNTRLVKAGIVEEVRKLKNEGDKDMAIFGSGSIVKQLAEASLVDEYQVVVNPIVLGQGRSMFEGLRQRIALKLARSRVFANGNVLLCYQPA